MKVQVLNKVASLSCSLLLSTMLLLFYAGAAVAEEGAESGGQSIEGGSPGASLSFISSYQEYSNAQYAVRWHASPNTIASARAKIARYSYLVLYSSKPLLNTSNVSVIQFGFFKTQKEASDFVNSNERAFPGLKVVSVSEQEHQSLFASEVTEVPALPEPSAEFYWLSPSTPTSIKSLQRLLKQAKTHYVNKDYTQALKYYGVLSLTQDVDTAVWSREIMGVCLERLGKREAALETYQELARDYPDAKSSGRIAQRLRALETAASDDKSPLRKAKNEKDDSMYWRGMIGQSYNLTTLGGQPGNGSVVSVDDPQIPSNGRTEDRDVMSALITQFDLHAGRRFGEHKLDVRLNGYDIYDMKDEDPNRDPNETFVEKSDSKTAIKRFYAKYENKRLGLSAIGGRQRDLDSGMYMSFDGGSVRYALNDRWSFGASAGVPAYLSEFSDYIDRQFYSLYGRFEANQHWSVSGYFTQQTFFGEIERSAVGGSLKYFSESLSSYLNIDYDLEFQELNILRWSGTYLFSRKSQATLSYGFQRTPFLTASNIQVGQPYLDVEAEIKKEDFDYQNLLSEALERTSTYEYGSLSYRYRVDDGLQLVTDLSHSRLSEIPAFLGEYGGRTSEVIRNDEYYLYSSAGIQAIAHGFFGQKDTAVLSFRQSSSTTSTSSLIQVSERLKFGKRISIKPKVSFKSIKRKGDEAGQTRVRGSVSLNYKPVRSAEIRAEFGSEVIKGIEDKNSVDLTYFILGYQARF